MNLDLLKNIAHAIAVQFGSNCEVLIHDLKADKLSSSIVYIENGHVSNRKIGDGPSHIVLEAINSDPDKLQDRLGYHTKTKDGRILMKSDPYASHYETRPGTASKIYESGYKCYCSYRRARQRGWRIYRKGSRRRRFEKIRTCYRNVGQTCTYP